MIASVLAYLALLPLSVWLLGSVFSLLDHEDRAVTLRRVAWRTLPLLGFALLMGSRAATLIVAALLTALVLHLIWFFGSRTALRRGWLAEPGED